MSFDTRTAVAEPSAPSGTTKMRAFYDINDNNRRKYKASVSGLLYSNRWSWPRNALLNAGFNYAQRQVAGTLTSRTPGTASRAYGADRWFVANEANDVQFQQIDTIGAPETGLQHEFYGKLKKITAVGKILTGQILTAEATAPLRGRRVRVQCWMKRNNALTMRLGLAQLTSAGVVDTVPGYVAGAPSGSYITAWNGTGVDPTLGSNVSAIAPVANSGDGGTISGNALTCVLGTGWVRYSAVFDVPSNCKNLIWQVWSDAQLAVNDEFNLAQCMLVDGVDIQDWVAIDTNTDLDGVLAFYHKSFPRAVVPATNAGLTGAWRGNAAQAGAVSFVHGFIPFVVAMRAAPTVTYFNPAAANNFLRQLVTPSDATATSATQITERGAEVTATGLAAWALGHGVAIHYTADAEL